jgi:hypothetical protein
MGVFMIHGVLTADDNFPGRSRTRFGLGELIYLSFTATAQRTPRDLGGLRWVLLSGSGTLSAHDNNGLGTFVAGSSPERVRLQLRFQSGPHAGTGPVVDLSVIAPNDATMVQEPGTPLYHDQNTCSVGFSGLTYLLPKDVSFKNLEFREDTARAIGSGFFTALNNLEHPQSDWFSIGPGNSLTGCPLSVPDSVRIGPGPVIRLGPPYRIGTFHWPIPWQYRLGTGPAVTFTTAHQHATADANGRATIQKKGAGPVARDPGDPDSDYYPASARPRRSSAAWL